jgi:hypothetical protein
MANKKQTINPVVTGAVIGAGIGAAAGAAMTNPKTRKKAEEVVGNVKKQATDYMKSMNKTGMEEGKKAIENIATKAGISKSSMTKGKRMMRKAANKIAKKPTKK